MKLSKTAYDVLGLQETASVENIKHAWRTIARQTHPDRTDDPRAIEAFKKAKEAYDLLSDPVQRLAYDRLLQSSTTHVCVTCGAPVLFGLEKCVRCTVLSRVPSPPPSMHKAEARTSTRRVDLYEEVIGKRSPQDHQGPLPQGTTSESLVDALMAESSMRAGFEVSLKRKKKRTVFEVKQGKSKLRVEVDPNDLRRAHDNLQAYYRAILLLKDLFS